MTSISKRFKAMKQISKEEGHSANDWAKASVKVSYLPVVHKELEHLAGNLEATTKEVTEAQMRQDATQR